MWTCFTHDCIIAPGLRQRTAARHVYASNRDKKNSVVAEGPRDTAKAHAADKTEFIKFILYTSLLIDWVHVTE